MQYFCGDTTHIGVLHWMQFTTYWVKRVSQSIPFWVEVLHSLILLSLKELDNLGPETSVAILDMLRDAVLAAHKANDGWLKVMNPTILKEVATALCTLSGAQDGTWYSGGYLVLDYSAA